MPRRKISSSDAKDLPKLTDKQRDFCAGILAGKSQRQAYRDAYDCTNMSDAAVDVDASRLRHHPKIALWLDAARYDALKDHACTYDGHLAELERLKAIAIRTGNIGAAVQAEQLRGKAAGHYVEQYRDLTDEDPHTILDRIAAHDVEAAKRAAQKHGIRDWSPPSEAVH